MGTSCFGDPHGWNSDIVHIVNKRLSTELTLFVSSNLAVGLMSNYYWSFADCSCLFVRGFALEFKIRNIEKA